MARISITALAALVTIGCGVQFAGNGESSSTGPGGDKSTTAVGGGGHGGDGATGPGGMGAAGGDGGTGGMAGAGGSGGTGGAATCPTGLPGPELVAVTSPTGAFCIDRSEVTAGQYAAFVAAAPAASTDPNCNWNASYVPDTEDGNCGPSDYDPINAPLAAAACVDWCDARDYCQWASKRLCRAHDGGPTGYDDATNPAISEWMWACTGGGLKLFPYGNSYEPLTCISDDYDGMNNGSADHPYHVLDAPMCLGGFGGIVGMSGNVWEYEDACNTAGAGDPSQDQCRRRGGSFWDTTAAAMQCDHVTFPVTRDSVNKNDGFRCCADPLP
jgi:formylglycine-generating enzyme required for sulfatase activity